MWVFLVILVVIVIFFRTPQGKGIIGEIKVRIALGKNKEDKKYVINNIIVVNDGKSSEIDHIVLKKTGIFVIETKNYSGQIYGGENELNWTQTLSYGKVKNSFYNPILQNRTHIYQLSKILERNDCFVSLISFPKADLKTKTVTHVGNIRSVKNEINKKKKELLTTEELNYYYSILLELKGSPKRKRRDHVKSIKKMKSDIENNICPRCGRELVIRKGRYDSFYGCLGYPECTFKKKITN